MPYLQKKMTKLHLERPKSSPGVRPNDTKEANDEQCSQHDRSSGVCGRSQIQPQCQSHRHSNPAQILSMYANSGSVETLKLCPSGGENTLDDLPLYPKPTDHNYNAYDTFDRNKSLCGIDNPGISDSTEDIIRQNLQSRSLDNHQHSNSSVLIRSTSVNQNGVSGISSSLKHTTRMESVPTDTTHVRNGLSNNLQPKKSKLDPELILEDIENTDCFPYDVKLSDPYRMHGISGNAYSSESLLIDADDIDTIELNDVARSRSKSLEPESNSQHQGKDCFESVSYQVEGEKMEINYKCSEERSINVKNAKNNPELNEGHSGDRTPDISVSDKQVLLDSMETSFCVEGKTGEHSESMYRKRAPLKPNGIVSRVSTSIIIQCIVLS